jgi:fumarate reductase subunit D
MTPADRSDIASRYPLAARRRHHGFVAFLLHRLSGIVLAVFLPVHFLTLGLAIEGADAMQTFLDVADSAVVKLFEIGLVVALVAHLMGGLRLIMLEWWRWDNQHATWLSLSLGVGCFMGLMFALSIVV